MPLPKIPDPPMTTTESLFEVGNGHQLALNDVQTATGADERLAYVTRSHRHNGVRAWVKRIDGLTPAAAGDISVCLRSRNHALSAFVQPYPFYTTFHVAVLTPKREMSLQEKLWWCLCIQANRHRYNFGRQANRTIGKITLPDKVPDWVGTMSIPDYGAVSRRGANVSVDTSIWAEFRLSDIFEMHVGKHSSRRSLGSGETPLVTASAQNNGISAMVAVKSDWPGGQITVPNNGSIGAAFYQPRAFTASRDVTILVPKTQLSPAAALFVCTVLRKESAQRYNYARKWTTGRMRDSLIRLPASEDGTPDVASMDALVTALPLWRTLSRIG